MQQHTSLLNPGPNYRGENHKTYSKNILFFLGENTQLLTYAINSNLYQHAKGTLRFCQPLPHREHNFCHLSVQTRQKLILLWHGPAESGNECMNCMMVSLKDECHMLHNSRPALAMYPALYSLVCTL